MASGTLVTLEVDRTSLKRVESMFSTVDRWATIKLPTLTKQIAEEGKFKAVTLAPKRTGALVNAIRTEKTPNSTGYSIFSRTPAPSASGRQVPYQYFIHLGKYGYRKYSGRKTGDHQYMVTTWKYLRQRFPEMARKSMKDNLK